MPSKAFKLVLVTVPNQKTARLLARAALEAHLVACANIFPGVESHYHWQGKIEKSAELLVLFKTTTRHLKSLEKLVVARHPYDTPEFVVINVSAGNQRYLQWWQEACVG